MAFDITPYIDKKPAEVRQLIREGRIDFPTAGMCRGYAQANLVILPPEYAADPGDGRGWQHLLGHPPVPRV